MMGAQTRAGRVKAAMDGIIEDRSKLDEDVSSASVVRSLWLHHQDAIEHDRDEIIMIGLMVIAGRVATRTIADPAQLDLLSDGEQVGRRKYIPVRVGGKTKGLRSVFDLRPESCYPLERKPHPVRQNTSVEVDHWNSIMKRMIDEGKSHLSTGEYLRG